MPDTPSGSSPKPTPIGSLRGPPPYRAWMLHRDPSAPGPWGVQNAAGHNCFGLDGAVFLRTRERAEEVIRSHGHEPGEPVYG